jgi:ribose-phosphate pyrophosphokinase
VLFTGSAHPGLAGAVARAAGCGLGLCTVERYPDGEVSVVVGQPVRRRDVYLLQSTSPPVNEHLVELLALADACRRGAAARITAVVPYFGYSRADKRHGRREPITAGMVADLFQAVGIAHVVTVDPHTPQLEGFFRIPVDSLTALPLLCEALRSRLAPDAVVVSPDAGRVRMATEYAARLDRPLVVLHKRRRSGTQTAVTHLVGDVRGRACLVIDDMIATGGTMAETIEALLEAGARAEIVVAATHGLLLPGARDKLSHAAVREIVVTDTVRVEAEVRPPPTVVSVAPLLAGAIQRFLADGSLSDLY